MEVAERLQLGDEPDAVPRARRFAVASLSGLFPDELVDDATLIISELVTNAFLHGKPPVVVRISAREHLVHIEVADDSRSAPVRGRPDSNAMTGRGMGLIESLSSRWGVAPEANGKKVWCEIETTSDGIHSGFAAVDLPMASPVDVIQADWGRPEGDGGGRAEPTFVVALGDVPTDLLLAAKAHVDNLVREFTLAASGAVSGATAIVPVHLAALIDSVLHGFAEARSAIKRQALAAADVGAARTHLSLTLPISAAEAGDAYLAGLDEADGYARAARLLTLETPPQHRAFRRWYVQSLIVQLRAIAAGEPPPTPESFEQRLLAELETVTAARQIADRGARPQIVTAALSGATTVDEVTSFVVQQGLDALGASSGAVLLRADHDRLAVSSAVGYVEKTLNAMRAEGLDAHLPAASVLRTGKAVWLESRQEIAEMFPGLGELEPRTQSMCAVPAALAGRVLGALRFSFTKPRLFDDDERRFILALAAQAAQALDRGSLYGAEQRARAAAETLAARLSRLQRLTAELTNAADPQRVADIVVAHARDAFDSTGVSLCLLEPPDTLRIIAIVGVPDDLVAQFRTFDLHAQLPGSEAVRSNAPVLVRDREELLARYPALIAAVPREGGLIVVPLRIAGRSVGAISLQFAADRDIGGVGGADELAFLSSLADAAAQAIDRARAQAAAREATDKLTFLADASAELATSMDYRSTLTNVARLVVPRLADWCGIQIIEDGRFETVAVAHVDPTRISFAAELQRRYPTDPEDTAGAPNVARTGVSELYADVTPEMVADGAVDDQHLQMLSRLGMTSVLIVPLTGRGGTFGALTLVYAESGRHFDETDRSLAEEVARRAALAVDNARDYHQQSGRLAAITRVAEAAQQAILAPVPRQVGPVALAGAYVSAAREALGGGDMYEVVTGPHSVRLLVGDVRGKGLDAVRLATVVLGYFRAAAGDAPTLADAATQIDARLSAHLQDEDFVTAMLVEIHDDGRTEILSCGHPGPLLANASTVSELHCPPALPLGLGTTPEPLTIKLRPKDRLLLFTDGLIEARDAEGQFAELMQVVEPLRTGRLETVLEEILDELRNTVGGDLDDDLALLAAEYRP